MIKLFESLNKMQLNDKMVLEVKTIEGKKVLVATTDTTDTVFEISKGFDDLADDSYKVIAELP